MRILVFPKSATQVGGNPYCKLLYDNMREFGVEVEEFSVLRALWGNYEIFHLHWPDYYLNQAWPKAMLGIPLILCSVAWVRIRGTRVIWTAHNLRSHKHLYPSVERWFWAAFTNMLDGWISLSKFCREEGRRRFLALRSLPCVVVPHGHYRDAYPSIASRTDARRKLRISAGARVILFLGRVSRYKNVPHLVETFRRAAIEDSVLVVAGQPASNGDRLSVREVARESGNIQLHLAYVPMEELQVFFAATDLVVLPYSEISNSGSAILALSFSRPTLVPAQGSLPELQEHVGSGWIRTYEGELTPSTLTEALRWSEESSREHHPDLTAFEWPQLALGTFLAYRQFSANPLQRSSGNPDTGMKMNQD
jgi:beta-1,4-mannosyltransferase